MSIVLDAVTSSNNGTFYPASYNWSHTVASGAAILVVSVSVSGSTVSSVTFNGVSLTRLTYIADSGIRSEIWYLVSPASGAHSVVVTLAASALSSAIAHSWLGVSTTAPWGTPATAAASTSVNVTSDTGQVVVDALSSTLLGTAHSGQTLILTKWAYSGIVLHTSYKDGTTTTTMSWDGISASYLRAICAAPLLPAPAGPSIAVLLCALGEY